MMNGWGNPRIVNWDIIRAEQVQDNHSVTTFTFKGQYDKLPDLQLMYQGDIVLIKDKTYVSMGDKWEELCDINDMSTREEVIEEPIFSNCRNCGSPMIYAGRCAYCGTPQPTRTIRRKF